MKNYYEILEVNRKASKEVIEKAYKVLIRKYHPDLYTGEKKYIAEKRTKEINEAYRILSDEFLKEQYDAELERQELENKQMNYQMQDKIKKKQKEEIENTSNEKKYRVGSLGAVVQLTKQLINDIIKSKEKREEIKEVTKKDILAIVLTIIVVIIIGIILWFIPFTNGWMKELLFENPLFSWIGKLFS